tara:strand:+ start:53 stop:328 length:276 start_codon:yes stop_codon:yes gene_type:complete
MVELDYAKSASQTDSPRKRDANPLPDQKIRGGRSSVLKMDGPIEAGSGSVSAATEHWSSVLKMDGPIEAVQRRLDELGITDVFRPENGRPH